MAKSATPFFNGDFGKFDFAAFFDPKKFAEQMEAFDFAKVSDQFKVPGIDAEAFVQSQRKNVEALTAANRVAFEGAWALMQRQSEIVRQSMEDVSKVVSELSASGPTEDKLAKEVDLLKDAYTKALVNTRELAEMSAKSQTEAAELLSARVTESLDEIKVGLKKAATTVKK